LPGDGDGHVVPGRVEVGDVEHAGGLAGAADPLQEVHRRGDALEAGAGDEVDAKPPAQRGEDVVHRGLLDPHLQVEGLVALGGVVAAHLDARQPEVGERRQIALDAGQGPGEPVPDFPERFPVAGLGEEQLRVGVAVIHEGVSGHQAQAAGRLARDAEQVPAVLGVLVRRSVVPGRAVLADELVMHATQVHPGRVAEALPQRREPLGLLPLGGGAGEEGVVVAVQRQQVGDSPAALAGQLLDAVVAGHPGGLVGLRRTLGHVAAVHAPPPR
jgi:hypothetical protein